MIAVRDGMRRYLFACLNLLGRFGPAVATPGTSSRGPGTSLTSPSKKQLDWVRTQRRPHDMIRSMLSGPGQPRPNACGTLSWLRVVTARAEDF